jgi:hypothetical protein
LFTAKGREQVVSFPIDQASDIEALNAARSDRKERQRQHAKHCVLLAVLTSEPLAAELIDKAIVFRAESQQD